MNREVTVGDLLLTMDLIDELTEESDTLPLERAIQMRETLSLLASALKRAQSMIDTQVLNLLEQPTIVGERRYVPATKYAKRWGHYRIAKMVADQAKVDRTTGEIRTVDEAVAGALHQFIQIYLSDSSEAKVSMLRKVLGVGDPEAENLVTEVATGRTVNVYDVEASDAKT
jgi:hypothetical protein